MKVQRWKEIDDIFAAALERDSAERQAFLAEACGGDEALRAEVESLLAHNLPESLFGGHAVHEATRLLEQKAGAGTGDQIGHYRIIRSLGVGGMGRVYLGLDEKLNRPVAIKLLSNYDATEKERVRRFVLEAQAAAALNHPNIAHIYEISEDKGTNFIAMEYVDGETLREKLREGSELEVLLKYLLQVAQGLAKAHAGGIVHRDLKPDNVMITSDGHVKILDFGLAKLLETTRPKAGRDEGPGSSEMATAMMPLELSTPGVVMGTVGYMSPEQAQAKSVDQRSDIFSFGCILYETVTGRKPFAGESVRDTLNKIISEPAPSISDLNPSASPELQRVIRKCLAKEPDKRYQTIVDTANDLEELIQEMRGPSEIDRSVAPSTSATTSGRTNRTDEYPRAESTESVGRERTSSVKYSARNVVDSIKQYKYAVVIVLSLIAAASFFAYRFLLSNKSQPIESIAVMPFFNESGNGDIDYLSDGMTDSLINSLSQLPHLSVKARSSVFRYKGKEIDPQRIATELSVQAILSGRVVQHGDDLTLYLSLVEGRSGNQIWGEQYHRKLSDLVALQQDISREVSDKLRLKLTGEQQRLLTKSYTDNNEAYELYLKGRYFSHNPTEANLRKSIEYFQQAVARDPNYALAYTGMGSSYQTLGGFLGFVSPNEAAPEGKAAIVKALSIDETLDDAHAALAQFSFYYDWNLPAAEREYKRTFELNPDNAAGHSSYGTYLEALGRFDEAVAERERSRHLDPTSAFSTADVGYPLYYARRYERALEYFKRGLELDPNLSWGHLWIGQVYVQQGRFDEGITEIRQAMALSGGNVRDIATLGHAYAVSGKKNEALKIIAQLQGQLEQKYVSPYFIALIYTGLGDKEQAFVWLEKAYQQRHPYLVLIKVEPVFDSLRSDPRFADLLRRIGLTQ
jgi:serine/threonine-protein kinase